jgi:hypothetical protein
MSEEEEKQMEIDSLEESEWLAAVEQLKREVVWERREVAMETQSHGEHIPILLSKKLRMWDSSNGLAPTKIY